VTDTLTLDNDSLAVPGVVQLPDVLPIFPLPKTVLLPAEVLPLHIFEPRYRALVRDALASHRLIGMVDVLPGHENEIAGSPPVRPSGCVGIIAHHTSLDDGRFLLWLIGLERFDIRVELEVSTPYRQVQVSYASDTDSGHQLAGILPLRQDLRQVLEDLADVEEEYRMELGDQLQSVTDPQLVAVACQILQVESDRKQAILEASSVAERILMVYQDLYQHLEQRPEIAEVDPSTLN
jgi:Lon protease-like protein